jgi:sortase A
MPRRTPHRMLIASGFLIVAGVVAWQVNATLWTNHSEQAGRALVHRFLQNPALSNPVESTDRLPGAATLASCASAQSSDPVKGLLEIPKLGVIAPVEQGTGDAQLNVAVGHDPYSVWPGEAGNAVLEAHDVSYFVGLPKLVAGDDIRYVAPCTTYEFQVSAHTVVNQGAPVYNTPNPTMTLVTCWPTDALWFTPDRYLVTAVEVGRFATGAGARRYVTASLPPSVPVAPALASQGVTLATYSLPMGSFTLSGSPDPTWAQSTNPLLVEDSAVEAFIAGVRSLTEGHLDWWGELAPGVSPPAPLVGARNPSYLTPLEVTVSATGTQATAVTLTDTVQLQGGEFPGRYSMAVEETIHRGTLTVASWVLQPA